MFEKLKSSLKSGKPSKDSEPTYSIQPHPAKTNDPADLQPRQGLRSGGGLADAFNARPPHIPNEQVLDNLPPPSVSFIRSSMLPWSLIMIHLVERGTPCSSSRIEPELDEKLMTL
ncbi:hypothetical protein DL96DRAFT_1617537 [Flagelloscypha sp. PMI_526]|nr:hypothetical protein DL96DRAFT_1617537 [Flagelloscypha sp. PMI_526]